MDTVDELTLLEVFMENAAAKRREKRLAEESERVFKQWKEEQHETEKERKFYQAIIAATQEQMAAFTQRLDNYDTAAVRALMENEQALDEVRRKRKELEDGATKLPDGRSVFKTEDGKHVFDQHGVEVPRDIIAPEQIPDSLPKFEVYKANDDKEKSLLETRQEIHDFQKRVDEARETVNNSPASAKALDQLGADLELNMPAAVRSELAGGSAAAQADKPGAAGAAQARQAAAVGAQVVPEQLRR
jgi:hypothetical protein